jgi:phosphoribosylanthranilate isomerase
MRIKICGITRPDDALCAVDAGADMIGFIFVPESKRYIIPAQAARIIAALPGHVLPVGVFVDVPRNEVLRTIEESGIRAIQLHGEESPEDTDGYMVQVFKAHRVRPAFDMSVLAPYSVDAHLLDTYVSGMHGGTGMVFDWNVARAASAYGKIILGGGLTPENVARAIRRGAPSAVDVSSGVEFAPGIKAPEKIRRFIVAAQEAFNEMDPSMREGGA